MPDPSASKIGRSNSKKEFIYLQLNYKTKSQSDNKVLIGIVEQINIHHQQFESNYEIWFIRMSGFFYFI